MKHWNVIILLSKEQTREVDIMSENKIITVLLTQYNSTFSNFIYYTTGRGYTHASLSLNNEEDCFYSFNFKGFRKEHPSRHKSQKSVSYCLEVTEEEYVLIQNRIQEMENNREELSYSRVGVILCLLQIPLEIRNHYFCSQFVAGILQQTNSVQLEKRASLYLPNQLPGILEKQKCLRQIIYNPV